ncbi:MAG: polyhydroxyalkanoic acid system family protein [Burkholderiales bacterium]|nr:polyhydroxyalkanoic acid system family protein [Burkholderiales bacterium]
MSEIRIRREHTLGLKKARQMVLKFAEDVEEKFDMECTLYEGETSDTLEFTRSGVRGQLIVTGEHLEMQAKLGLLLGAFAGKIEAEITKNLDAALAKASAKKK